MSANQIWLVCYFLLLAVMTGMAAIGYLAWKGVGQLPMQWGVDGKPTWFAGTGFALAFFPLLAVVTTNLDLLSSGSHLPGRVRVFLCAGVFAIQVVYLMMARRWLDKQSF